MFSWSGEATSACIVHEVRTKCTYILTITKLFNQDRSTVTYIEPDLLFVLENFCNFADAVLLQYC